jgi:hypothetical protein
MRETCLQDQCQIASPFMLIYRPQQPGAEAAAGAEGPGGAGDQALRTAGPPRPQRLMVAHRNLLLVARRRPQGRFALCSHQFSTGGTIFVHVLMTQLLELHIAASNEHLYIGRMHCTRLHVVEEDFCGLSCGFMHCVCKLLCFHREQPSSGGFALMTVQPLCTLLLMRDCDHSSASCTMASCRMISCLHSSLRFAG